MTINRAKQKTLNEGIKLSIEKKRKKDGGASEDVNRCVKPLRGTQTCTSPERWSHQFPCRRRRSEHGHVQSATPEMGVGSRLLRQQSPRE